MSTETTIGQLSIAIQCGIPALLIGPPGQGKTAVMEGVARKLGLSFVSVSAAVIGPEDIMIPFPGRGKEIETRFHSWAIQAINEPTLVLIDELTRATSRAGFNVLLRILQERMIYGTPVHPGTRFVATANPESTDSGCMAIPSALANRIAWFTGDIDIESWRNWMLGMGGAESETVVLPNEWEQYVPDASAIVVGFLKAMPALVTEEPKEGADPGPWPSRRSWTNAARLIGASLAMKDRTLGYRLAASVVGNGPAAALTEYMGKANLPEPAEVLDNPGYTWPARLDIKFTIMSGIVAEAMRRNTKDGYAKLEGWFQKMPGIGSKDVGAYGLSIFFSQKNRERAASIGYRLSGDTARMYQEIVNASGILSGR